MKYLVAHTDDARRLGLSGAEAWVYCALCCLTRKQPFNGSMTKLAEESMCPNKVAAWRAVQQLKQKGLVVSTPEGLTLVHNETPALHSETPALHSETESLHNETISKRKVPKENNNIIKEKGGGDITRTCARDTTTDTTTTFSLFWNHYAASGENWNNERIACKKIFDLLTPEEQQLAITNAPNHRKGRNPYWWLKERNWDMPEHRKELRILSGQEADMAKAMGARVVVARTPDGKYKTVLAQDAEAFSLHILREF